LPGDFPNREVTQPDRFGSGLFKSEPFLHGVQARYRHDTDGISFTIPLTFVYRKNLSLMKDKPALNL